MQLVNFTTGTYRIRARAITLGSTGRWAQVYVQAFGDGGAVSFQDNFFSVGVLLAFIPVTLFFCIILASLICCYREYRSNKVEAQRRRQQERQDDEYLASKGGVAMQERIGADGELTRHGSTQTLMSTLSAESVDELRVKTVERVKTADATVVEVAEAAVAPAMSAEATPKSTWRLAIRKRISSATSAIRTICGYVITAIFGKPAALVTEDAARLIACDDNSMCVSTPPAVRERPSSVLNGRSAVDSRRRIVVDIHSRSDQAVVTIPDAPRLRSEHLTNTVAAEVHAEAGYASGPLLAMRSHPMEAPQTESDFDIEELPFDNEIVGIAEINAASTAEVVSSDLEDKQPIEHRVPIIPSPVDPDEIDAQVAPIEPGEITTDVINPGLENKELPFESVRTGIDEMNAASTAEDIATENPVPIIQITEDTGESEPSSIDSDKTAVVVTAASSAAQSVTPSTATQSPAKSVASTPASPAAPSAASPPRSGSPK